MKKVIEKEELEKNISYAINMLCNTVKKTLGPICHNVIINSSDYAPYITNDGVTIAENITSDDEVVSAILEIIKTSSMKTNEVVGDGTTSTLVYLEAIYNEGLKCIKDGYAPIKLKSELDESLKKVLSILENKKKVPVKKDLLNIAVIAANDLEIGEFIYDAYSLVNSKEAILIEEGRGEETIVNLKKGYSFETNIASNYYFKNEEKISLDNANICLLDKDVYSLEELPNINDFLESMQELVVIANDYSEELINEVVSTYLDNEVKIILLKNPLYGLEKVELLKDIANITISKGNYLTCKKIIIDKNKTSIMFDDSNMVSVYKNKLIKYRNTLDDNYEKELLDRRINMLDKGIVEILVGGKTILERREKKMRFDDALCAIKMGEYGVVLGSGVTTYQIGDELIVETIGDKVLASALKTVLKQIINNAGLSSEVIDELKKDNFSHIYNVKTMQLESISETFVLDSAEIIKEELKNAVSIASLLLTTSSLVINILNKKINLINEI